MCTGVLSEYTGPEDEYDADEGWGVSRAAGSVNLRREVGQSRLGRRGVGGKVRGGRAWKKEEDANDDDQKGGLGHNRGWMRAVVDMYMAGECDGVLRSTATSIYFILFFFPS